MFSRMGTIFLSGGNFFPLGRKSLSFGMCSGCVRDGLVSDGQVKRTRFASQKDSFYSSKVPLLQCKRTTFVNADFSLRSENKGVPLPREAEGTQNQKNSHYFRSAHLLSFLTPYIFSCRHSRRARICRVLPLQRGGIRAFRWSCLPVHIIYR